MNLTYQRSGRSGGSTGHLLPAAVLIGCSTFLLLLTLKRARSLPRGMSFQEAHIPEKNQHLMFWLGVVVAASTGFMLCTETYYQIIVPAYHPLTHHVLYLSYILVGFVAILESKKRLPPDSHRRCLSLTLGVQFMIFLDHGMCKETPTDSKMHIMLAMIDLVGCTVVAFSVASPSSMEAYVASWVCLFLQGTWFVTLALYSGFMDISVERVCTYLGIQILIVTTTVVVVVAGLCPNYFSRATLKQHDDDEKVELL